MKNNIEKIKKIFLLSVILIPIIQIISFYLNGISNHLTLIISIIWIFLSIPIYIVTEKKTSNYIFISLNFIIFSLLLSFFYNRVGFQLNNVFFNMILTIIVFSINYVILKFFKYNSFINRLFMLLSVIFIIVGISQFKNELEILGIIIIIVSVLNLSLNFICTVIIDHGKSYKLLDIIKLYSLLLFISLLFVVLEELSENSFIDAFIAPATNRKKQLKNN